MGSDVVKVGEWSDVVPRPKNSECQNGRVLQLNVPQHPTIELTRCSDLDLIVNHVVHFKVWVPILLACYQFLIVSLERIPVIQ